MYASTTSAPFQSRLKPVWKIACFRQHCYLIVSVIFRYGISHSYSLSLVIDWHLWCYVLVYVIVTCTWPAFVDKYPVITDFSASDQLLMSHDFWIRGVKQMTLDTLSKVSNKNIASPNVTPWLQIQCLMYWAYWADC